MTEKAKVVREKYVAACKALFELEEVLGPSGTPPRRDVYRLRCELGLLSEHIRRMEKRAETIAAFKTPPGSSNCDHGVTFDIEAAHGLDAMEIRQRWPRGYGHCPKGCGLNGFFYASREHYIAGDW